jgi:hypothetical protein
MLLGPRKSGSLIDVLFIRVEVDPEAHLQVVRLDVAVASAP